MESCIFCKIANKKIPAEFIYEDDYAVAFNDLSPQAPTHVLVIPKKHYASLSEIDDKELLGGLMNAVRKTASKLGLTDYRTVINTGSQAGQTVFHIHVHLLAGRAFNWPPG